MYQKPVSYETQKGNTQYQIYHERESNSNENVIANGFCSFFQSAVSTPKANSIKLKNFTWSKPIKHQTNYAKPFNFQHVSVPVVRKHLKGLKKEEIGWNRPDTSLLTQRLCK